MFFRLPLLLACVLSLALGPVQFAEACAVPTVEKSCDRCCGPSEAACCVASDPSTQEKTPATLTPQTVDGKLMAAPVLVVVGLNPLPAMERPSFYEQQQAARIPVAPRLDVTCIRLI